MLAMYTPAPIRGIMRSSLLDKMYKKWFLEVGRWSAHIPDSIIIDDINKDKNLLLYAINFKGVNLFTHAGCKSFFANIRPDTRQTVDTRDINTHQR